MTSTVCLTFDFDAMSVWFGYAHTTPAMLSRGEYGATVGVPRILELLKRYNIRSTFFIPGHTVESFPHQVDAILAAGHEVGHHSYAHVDPSEQTPDEERRDMERALHVLRKIGVEPQGFRSPSADFSQVTLSLLEEYKFRYDSSLMADDFSPYHPRIGDQVSRHEPLIPGRVADIWELPFCFEFDDWAHFQFNFNPYRNGTSAPSKVFEIWTKDFDWMHHNHPNGVLTAAMHPQVIGRGHRIEMLEQFIQHVQSRRDTQFSTQGEVVARLG
jgi:peptidoglycan/xylan/chitin deacetylase (PgdA/CDA1 family)